MRRVIPGFVLVALLAGGCSSSEPLAFDLAQPMEPPPTSFTITGAAVDKGLVCPGGMFVEYQMEDAQGEPVSHERWSEMFDQAMDTASVAEVTSRNVYRCDDGSGTITVAQQVRFDFAEIDLATFGQGRRNAGTWTLAGTGDYESLSGSGDIVNDSDQGLIHMVGQVEA